MTYAARKLIEVALPLEAINKASVRENYIYRGNPSAVHKWWAQRPLATARAVIFAQMVDDPTEYTDELISDPARKRSAERELKKRGALWADRDTKGEEQPDQRPTLRDCLADLERERLFALIEELVQWENTTNEAVLDRARGEIWQSWRRACAKNADHPRARELFDRNKLPAFHDPFAGGGTLPLEAQRLGFEAYATDLNPVAVLINKALLEIPPKFLGQPPVNPEARAELELLSHDWQGTQGLAEDVHYYGRWMREQAEKRIGHLYPKVEVTAEAAAGRPDLKPYIGRELTPVAWLWARTVRSPNPAFGDVEVPLTSTFVLSSKPGREVWVEPVIESGNYRLEVRVGQPPEAAKSGTSAGKRAAFRCLMSGTPLTYEYIRSEGRAGRLGQKLMAVVLEGNRKRLYVDASHIQESLGLHQHTGWAPEGRVPARLTGGTCVSYGLEEWSDIFTGRQLASLECFCDLLTTLASRLQDDCKDSGAPRVGYAEALSLYCAFALDKTAEYSCTIVPWYSKEDRPKGLFARQAIPMVWDFAEVNPLADIGGTFAASAEIVAGSLGGVSQSGLPGFADQLTAVNIAQFGPSQKLISTDPPYYDNIAYADLSDFFYVWLRRNLKDSFPGLLGTMETPKSDEIIAAAYRHKTPGEAEFFFLSRMRDAMRVLSEVAHPFAPITLYYAFKQSDLKKGAEHASTGWEVFLDAVIQSGLALQGTWPIWTERGARAVGQGTNALASSIVLVCRPRNPAARTATRREFLDALKAELPRALDKLQRGNIAPVDLAQASIGPGMAVYTRYARVVDAEGKTLSVREALSLINQTLDEVLAEQEGDFDADSRWAVAWFDSYGFAEGEYGVAEVLSKAKATAVTGLVEAKIVVSRAGKVRLLRPDALDPDWNPATDPRLTVWEITHQLIRRLEGGGEAYAAELAAALGVKAEVARELAYRLYVVCERKKRAEEARSYNGLVQSWPEITRLAQDLPTAGEAAGLQPELI